MVSQGERPRLAVIVGNAITGDSRVQKTAIAAARDGWDVTLIGRSYNGKIERSWMGPIAVVRVPVWKNVRRHIWYDRQHGTRSKLTQFGIGDDTGLRRYQAEHRSWMREQTSEIGWLPESTSAQLQKNMRKAWIKARHTVYRARVKAYRWEKHRYPDLTRPTGDWRLDQPELLDIDIAFGQVLEELKPHVIHANDVTMIGPAARSAARLKAMGHKCGWLYDAHEYVEGVEWGEENRQTAYPMVEAEFIGHADAVSTVSPEIARLLQEAHGLKETPAVVLNAPVREVIGEDAPVSGVRQLCGLTEDQPLFVYAGWIDRQRGLEAVIGGLPEVPEAHVALVTKRQNPNLDVLLAQAEELGVRDRVHVLPYVPQHAVADYLASADFGLIPFRKTPNCELSLPTKMAEYLHAGIPVVASDVKTVKAFVAEHGIGEIFISEDASSFAEAAAKAIVSRDTLAEAITEELRDELSWEHQAYILGQIYRRISGVSPKGPRGDVPWTITEQIQKSALLADDADGEGGAALEGWRELTTETPIRLGMGIANYAGQLASYAQALGKLRDDVSCEVVMATTSKGFGYPADVYLDNTKLKSVDLQVEQVERVLKGRYTHLIADAFRPVLGELNGDHIGADLPALQRAKLKVALLAHGSEIRHPGRHMERYEESLFFDAPEDILKSLTFQTERNRRTAAESGLPCFVTTPDLLADLPWATWTPLVVDVDAWVSDRPVMERKRPVVLHAPSKRWTKGSNRIMPVLQEMHDSGVIDFQMLEGSSWKEVRERVKSADIIVDQFSIGAYGTFSCEAMAAGRPVLCYISEEVEAATGPLPIVNATAKTLRSALESLLDDRDRAVEIGRASAEFVRENHDGRRTAAALGSFLV